MIGGAKCPVEKRLLSDDFYNKIYFITPKGTKVTINAVNKLYYLCEKQRI